MENVLVDRAQVRLRRPARLLRLASDERLVALVRAGEESAFEALYDRHHAAILGFCRHLLGTREEAEDAVQHTFLAAFRDLARNEKPIELRPWLFAIARNRCVSLLRARRAHVAIELAEPACDGLAATIERREDLRELLTDLARLPEEQRAALLLAELGALDHAGIATVLGCPREKVKALVFQARTSLAASREARATPCDEIRLELATASGAALRRGPLRRHLRTCDGCRAFKAEVATQRTLLALALPVVPSLALKASVLSACAGGASSSSGGAAAAAAGATGAGAGSSAASGGVGGMLGGVASTGAGKVAVSLAVAGIVAGGGGTLAERLQSHVALPPASSSAPIAGSDPVSIPPFARGVAARRSAGRFSLSGTSTTPPAAQLDPAVPAKRADAQIGMPASDAPSAGPVSAHSSQPQHPPHPVQPSLGGKSAERHDSTPPGHSDAPPGHGGTPPGHGGTPPGQGKKAPDQGNTPPGQSNTPPGHGGTPPGQANTPPGHAEDPGPGAVPPGHGGSPPGQSKAASSPPESGTLPGNGR